MAIASDFDNQLALFLARCCMQTYNQYENDGQFIVPKGYKLMGGFKVQLGVVSEWFGFIIRSNSNVVIAFRGSSSFLDWLVDADLSQTEYPFVPGKAKTHTGFTAIYTSCREQVLALLGQTPPTANIYVTGHGPGGALAVLCAPDIAANTTFRKPIMYNFAGPRVGDPEFAALYNKRVKNSVRIVNIYDIVPHFPGAVVERPLTKKVWSYKHVQSHIGISLQTDNVAENHALSTYIEALQHSRPE